jgi:hypothetical protein
VFEAGRLEISASLAEAETLKGELLSLRRNGNTYEPHSSLVHDDLLMALALAAWRVGRYRKDLLRSPPDVLKRRA